MGGLGAYYPQIFFFFNRCSEIDSEAFWEYLLSVLKEKSAQLDSVLFWVVMKIIIVSPEKTH